VRGKKEGKGKRKKKGRGEGTSMPVSNISSCVDETYAVTVNEREREKRKK